MKKDITYIDGAKFEAIITARGLTPVPQAGFVKVSGAKGRNLYVARTKRVGRVDLSGFEYTGDGVRNLGGESFGAVTQQLRFDLPEEQVLANFTAILDHMLTLPAREVEKKAAEPKAKAPKAQGWSDKVAAPTPEDRAARLALIQKVAAEKGVKVSKKAMAQAEQA
jgi:hypothetical protein